MEKKEGLCPRESIAKRPLLSLACFVLSGAQSRILAIKWLTKKVTETRTKPKHGSEHRCSWCLVGQNNLKSFQCGRELRDCTGLPESMCLYLVGPADLQRTSCAALDRGSEADPSVLQCLAGQASLSHETCRTPISDPKTPVGNKDG